MNNGEHILIVDDNLKNLQVTAQILQDEGFLISLAESGPSALDMLKNQEPDLILLDITMPDMDGFEVCKEIQKNEKTREIPVIFLTANEKTSYLSRGFESGGVDYLTKPFIRQELLVRVRNHLNLARSKKEVLKLNRNLAMVFSFLAHDIRSPLSGMSQTLDAIFEGYIEPGSEDYKEIMSGLKKRISHTEKLLNRFLEWSRQQGEMTLKPDQFALKPLVDECVQLYQVHAENKKITINVDIDDSLEARIDPDAMLTVFRNLLSNAIKFSYEESEIEIIGRKGKDRTHITFRDHGAGMDEVFLDRIFLKDEHLTTRGTNYEEGNGLGIYIIKDLLARSMGRMEVKSEVGKGTDVSISLPQ